MAMEANYRLIEVDGLPSFYADDVASVLVIGQNVRVTFFEYRLLCGERVRYPVMDMIRPLASVRSGELIRMITESLAPKVEAVLLH